MMFNKAKVDDVVDRIVKEVRSPSLQERMINNVTDLSLRETNMLYDDVEFGDDTKLTKKRQLDIDWTDHAEYRGELRDVNPRCMNDMVREKLRTKFLKNPRDKGKVKFKGPEGTAVVDFNLSRNPADADVVTTWASEKTARVACELMQLAKVLTAAKWGHTLWITPRGKVINIPTGSDTHYDWINKNFEELFPNHEHTETNVFKIPMQEGWVHVRNHFSTLDIVGDKSAIRKQRKILTEIVEDRVVDGDEFSVSIDYDDGRGGYDRVYFFKLPAKLDEAKDALQ